MSVTTNLESAELSDEMLQALEQKAVEKMTDLAEYLSVISNQSYDIEFRNAAQELIEQSYISDSSSIAFPAVAPGLAAMTSRQSLEFQYLTSAPGEIEVGFDSVIIARELTKLTEVTWQGQLGFNTIVSGAHSGAQFTARHRGTEVFTVKKVEKVFGGASNSVWQVFLGEE